MNKPTIIARDSSQDTSSCLSPSINVGLSACLAGEKVRYNAGHTQSRLCLNTLSRYFNFKTFCPEVAAGFGTPRPTMRLIGDPTSPQLVFSDNSDTDLTNQLVDGFKDRLAEFSELDGYILMKNSPSCGLERVKVYQENGYPHPDSGAGIFAHALKQAYPNMPIEEEGRLHDNKIYENFIARVYAHHNFRREVLDQPSIHNLTQFHSSYKYLLMSHDQNQCREIGRFIAKNNHWPIEQLISEYFALFMQAMSKHANKNNHANALMHMLGYLKRSVPSAARQNIVTVIEKYQAGITPLSTPLTLLSHYLQQHGSTYINNQRYLEPYPEDINPIKKYC